MSARRIRTKKTTTFIPLELNGNKIAADTLFAQQPTAGSVPSLDELEKQLENQKQSKKQEQNTPKSKTKGNSSAVSPSSTGGMSLTTSPVGAKVFVDDAYAGMTPASITDLTPGEHRIRLQLEGYMTLEQTVRISAHRDLPLQISLDRSARTASLPSQPDISKTQLSSEEEIAKVGSTVWLHSTETERIEANELFERAAAAGNRKAMFYRGL